MQLEKLAMSENILKNTQFEFKSSTSAIFPVIFLTGSHVFNAKVNPTNKCIRDFIAPNL